MRTLIAIPATEIVVQAAGVEQVFSSMVKTQTKDKTRMTKENLIQKTQTKLMLKEELAEKTAIKEQSKFKKIKTISNDVNDFGENTVLDNTKAYNTMLFDSQQTLDDFIEGQELNLSLNQPIDDYEENLSNLMMGELFDFDLAAEVLSGNTTIANSSLHPIQLVAEAGPASWNIDDLL